MKKNKKKNSELCFAKLSYSIDGNHVISSRDNYKSFQQYGFTYSTSVKIIKDIWSINGWIGSNRFNSKGNKEKHNYTSLYGGANSNLLYKKYTLTLGFNTRYNILWGESISYGEEWNYVEAGYKFKEAKIALGMSLPLQSYWSGGSKNLSEIVPSESWSYIKENGQMLYIRFSWNASFGRKHQAGSKKLQNKDSDAGIL